MRIVKSSFLLSSLTKIVSPIVAVPPDSVCVPRCVEISLNVSSNAGAPPIRLLIASLTAFSDATLSFVGATKGDTFSSLIELAMLDVDTFAFN